MVHYKLTYFPARGRAETARQLFALAGVQYEDNRITHEQWAEFKSQTPFSQLPVLEVNGKQLAQADTINRYLARQFGFTGKTQFEEALVDSLTDLFKDFQNENQPFSMVFAGFKEGDKDQLYKDVAEPARDKFFNIIKQWLEKSTSGFLVGDRITVVDVALSEFIATFSSLIPGYLDGFPEAVAYAEKVRSTPALKKWIETRPATSF